MSDRRLRAIESVFYDKSEAQICRSRCFTSDRRPRTIGSSVFMSNRRPRAIGSSVLMSDRRPRANGGSVLCLIGGPELSESVFYV